MSHHNWSHQQQRSSRFIRVRLCVQFSNFNKTTRCIRHEYRVNEFIRFDPMMYFLHENLWLIHICLVRDFISRFQIMIRLLFYGHMESLPFLQRPLKNDILNIFNLEKLFYCENVTCSLLRIIKYGAKLYRQKQTKSIR